MELETLRSRLHPLDPIFLDSDEPGGGLRVLERSARLVCEVGPGGAHYQDLAADHLEKAFTAVREPGWQPPIRFGIDVSHGALGVEGLGRALMALGGFLGPAARSLITLHFPDDPRDWSAPRALVEQLHPWLAAARNVAIELSAPFVEFREADMEALFHLGVRLRFAAGWTGGRGADECLDVDAKVLRAFAEFGFRGVVEWYVHAANLALVEERLPDLLLANFNSGFALPLVSANPFYRFAPGFPSLPGASDYCQLLARAYAQYPYYDDVLYPLTGLALLVREGGWQSELSAPSAVRAIVADDGSVGLYRQSPTLALPWTTVDALAAAGHDELRADFARFARDAWRWDRNAYCRACDWRHVCGGLDGFAPSAAREEQLDTICAHRRLFLEHFARSRAPDSVVKAGPGEP